VTKRPNTSVFVRVLAVFVVSVLALAARNQRQWCRKGRASEDNQVSFGPVAELGPQLSPDGKLLAFEYFPADRPNVPQIWIMERSQGFRTARPLVDNANYNAEFSWSPDGQWISYLSHSLTNRPITSQIFKVKLIDGTTRQVTNFGIGKALGDSTSWSNNGLIAFEDNQDIYVVDESGGDARKLVEVGSRIRSLTPSEIRWSPDVSRLAFTGKEEQPGSERSRIWIANLRDQRISPVTDSKWDSTPSWFDNDHLLFSRGFSEGQARACVLCLKTGRIKCLTKGSVDLSPWGDAQTGEVFFARSSKSSANKDSKAFFGGFHLWRLIGGSE
jgi:Tol biopolymer transport system component